MMKHVSNTEEYGEFLDDIVQGRNENDPSSWRHVAKNTIQAFTDVGDDVTCTYSCEPYSTDWERVAPFDVLRYTDQEFRVDRANRLSRIIAVDVLEQDLKEADRDY